MPISDGSADVTWLTIARGLRQRWWLLIVCPLAAVLAVFVATSGADDTYRSETTMVIAPTAVPGDSFSSIDALRILEDRSIQGTFVEVASDDATVDGAAAQLSIDADRRQDFDVRPTIRVGSNLIEVAIVGPDALVAQQLCQLVVDNAITRFAALYPMYTIQVLQPADLATDPQQQTGPQDLALAILLGLGAAVLIAALWRRAEDLVPDAAAVHRPTLTERPSARHETEQSSTDPVEEIPPTTTVGAPTVERSVVDEAIEQIPTVDASEPAPMFKRRPSRVVGLAETTLEDSPEGAAGSRATAD